MVGTAIFSSVIGGLAYSTATQDCATKEAAFREIAERECFANDPSTLLAEEPKTNQEVVDRIRRLQALHDICNYATGGKGKKNV